MKKRLKVFNVGSVHDGSWIPDSMIVSNAMDADIITFPGGSDIHPQLYNDVVGQYTHVWGYADERDMEYAGDPRYKDKFKVGLCRGAQLLTAISGGKLVQHFVGRHGGGHGMMVDNDPTKILHVNSLHHQMMYPFDMDPNHYIIIGRACGFDGRALSTSFLNGHNKEMHMWEDEHGFIEPETVYYPETRSLGFQFHPEMMSWSFNKATLSFCSDLILKFIKQ